MIHRLLIVLCCLLALAQLPVYADGAYIIPPTVIIPRGRTVQFKIWQPQANGPDQNITAKYKFSWQRDVTSSPMDVVAQGTAAEFAPPLSSETYTVTAVAPGVSQVLLAKVTVGPPVVDDLALIKINSNPNCIQYEAIEKLSDKTELDVTNEEQVQWRSKDQNVSVKAGIAYHASSEPLSTTITASLTSSEGKVFSRSIQANFPPAPSITDLNQINIGRDFSKPGVLSIQLTATGLTSSTPVPITLPTQPPAPGITDLNQINIGKDFSKPGVLSIQLTATGLTSSTPVPIKLPSQPPVPGITDLNQINIGKDFSKPGVLSIQLSATGLTSSTPVPITLPTQRTLQQTFTLSQVKLSKPQWSSDGITLNVTLAVPGIDPVPAPITNVPLSPIAKSTPFITNLADVEVDNAKWTPKGLTVTLKAPRIAGIAPVPAGVPAVPPQPVHLILTEDGKSITLEISENNMELLPGQIAPTPYYKNTSVAARPGHLILQRSSPQPPPGGAKTMVDFTLP